MKYIKMLGLAAVAAAAVMAFLGAGTASATTLCTATETPCVHKDVNFIEASIEPGTTATLVSEEGIELVDTCTGSVVKGEVTNQGGAGTVIGKITSLTWSGCTFATKTITTGELELHHITGTENGTVTGKGNVVTVLAFGFLDCEYKTGTGTDLGTFTEGKPGTMDIKATVTASQSGCPASWWEGSYVVTNPTGTLVVEPS